ncbi:helix-turn-helix domain-containing protein [Microbulbifer sp. CnH-101-E]|uniref:helix-turn-helix domain-containing protein n=1 Tax=unclassified Microbulbifer TaxID=2619833 RepID=UPI004039C5C2
MKARELLETGTLQVEQIAWQVGYEDISAFRKMFHKQTTLSPREYRQRFSGGSRM